MVRKEQIEFKGEIKKLQEENKKLNERMVVLEDRITDMEKDNNDGHENSH